LTEIENERTIFFLFFFFFSERERERESVEALKLVDDALLW
jgi:hypothetical protein